MRKDMRVYSDGTQRGGDDGYRSGLLPGLRSSIDAQRLAEEVAFASARLQLLADAPPDLYAEVRRQDNWERATWMCFLIAYLSPLQDEAPFSGIRTALHACGGEEGIPDWREQEQLPDLAEIPLGPRTSHDPARGADTLCAYLQWAERSGSQVRAFSGDPDWSEQRRFERLFERLRLPGFGRMGRYDMLVTLGRLGLYEMRADSLHFGGAGAGAQTGDDLTTLAAKRLFGIGDPLILERRSHAFAEATSVPLEALDLAFANWGAGERVPVGVAADSCDSSALQRLRAALEL
jgi:hypothetical protein